MNTPDNIPVTKEIRPTIKDYIDRIIIRRDDEKKYKYFFECMHVTAGKLYISFTFTDYSKKLDLLDKFKRFLKEEKGDKRLAIEDTVWYMAYTYYDLKDGLPMIKEAVKVTLAVYDELKKTTTDDRRGNGEVFV